MKCSICKQQESEWAWQPFGPDESAISFTRLGFHYRGFPALKVCDDCKQHISSGAMVEFTYRKVPYVSILNGIQVQS